MEFTTPEEESHAGRVPLGTETAMNEISRDPDEIEENIDIVYALDKNRFDDEPPVEVEETEVELRGVSPAPEVDVEEVAAKVLESVVLPVVITETSTSEDVLDDTSLWEAGQEDQPPLRSSDHLGSDNQQDGYTVEFECEADDNNGVQEIQHCLPLSPDQVHPSSSRQQNVHTTGACVESEKSATTLLKSKKLRSRRSEEVETIIQSKGELEEKAKRDTVEAKRQFEAETAPDITAMGEEQQQPQDGARQGGVHPTRLRRIVKDSHRGDEEGKNDGLLQKRKAAAKKQLEAEANGKDSHGGPRGGHGSAVGTGGEDPPRHSAMPKRNRSRSHYAKRRVQAEDEDLSGVVLPSLGGAGQPRSSPQPTRPPHDAGRGTTDDEASLRTGRKPRKPLYQRMIERAQQQVQEEERQKHEAYAEKRKLKQRSNPTAEELREHRRRHDEVVHAKMEEHRRQLAESAAANARAVRRQQAVAAAVETALGEGGDRAALLVSGTSPLRRQQGRWKEGTPGETGSEALKDVGRRSEALGFSPAKQPSPLPREEDGDSGASVRLLLGDADTEDRPLAAVTENEDDQEGGQEGHGIHPVSLQFDESAAAAAVQKIPPLSAHAIPAYCASDWIDVLVTADYTSSSDSRRGLEEPTFMASGVSINHSSAQVLSLALRPALPHPDAEGLIDMSLL